MHGDGWGWKIDRANLAFGARSCTLKLQECKDASVQDVRQALATFSPEDFGHNHSALMLVP